MPPRPPDTTPNKDVSKSGRSSSCVTSGSLAISSVISGVHAGAKENAVFLVKWKPGDKMWLPYYQITHLNALSEYFELQGIESIEYLQEGTGHPPKDDIQNYIGVLHFCQGSSYKKTPYQTGCSSIFHNSYSSATHHVPSRQHSALPIPQPPYPTCQPRVLLATHKRDTGQHSRRATTSIPAVRLGSEGRSSSFHPAIRVPTVRQSVQQAPKHNRRMDDS
jgi:hypothetical protein